MGGGGEGGDLPAVPPPIRAPTTWYSVFLPPRWLWDRVPGGGGGCEEKSGKRTPGAGGGGGEGVTGMFAGAAGGIGGGRWVTT